MENPAIPLDRASGAGHYAKWPWGLSFQMVRTETAGIAWVNRALELESDDAALLEEFAWNIPIEKNCATQAARTKTFYAECYGGDGIHHNGGGVRCGWTGNWVVKGIGINLLSGYSDEDASNYRKNGRASLCEMFVEAIWGEVLNCALPYGAARMAAIIATGEFLSDTPYPTAGAGVREFVWRPAHFMRAYTFHVRAENRALIPSDTARVKEAIARLPMMLPIPASWSAQDAARATPSERLAIGLDEMVRRFAEQSAAAKAKRLSHGTLSPSNVSLDGRWNDLNSVTALPGYGFRRNMTPFWSDHLSLNKTIELLCFYISKYFRPDEKFDIRSLPTAAALLKTYRNYYDDALARRFVSLCGYPSAVVDRVWDKPRGKAAMRRLSSQLVAFARSGHSERRPYDDEFDKTTVAGDYDLPEILRAMAIRRPAAGRETVLQNLIADPAIRQSFSRCYCNVREMMVAEANALEISTEPFARLVAINCIKSGRTIPFLFRNLIFDKCRILAEEHRELGKLRPEAEHLIQSVLDEARTVYQDSCGFRTLLWCGGECTIEYDAYSDRLVGTANGQKFEFEKFASKPDHGMPTGPIDMVSAMRQYWGAAYEEMMQ
jgi:hypothetical protein